MIVFSTPDRVVMRRVVSVTSWSMSRSTETIVVSRSNAVGLPGQRPDDVVGLEALELVDRDAERLDDLADLRELVPKVVRHARPGRLVLGVLLVPERRTREVERDRHVIRLEIREAAQDDAAEAEDAVDQLTLRRRQRGQSVVTAVHEPEAVEQHQAFHRRASPGCPRVRDVRPSVPAWRRRTRPQRLRAERAARARRGRGPRRGSAMLGDERAVVRVHWAPSAGAATVRAAVQCPVGAADGVGPNALRTAGTALLARGPPTVRAPRSTGAGKPAPAVRAAADAAVDWRSEHAARRPVAVLRAAPAASKRACSSCAALPPPGRRDMNGSVDEEIPAMPRVVKAAAKGRRIEARHACGPRRGAARAARASRAASAA